VNAPAPLGPNWKPWGETLVRHLNRVYTKLRHLYSSDTAAENGHLLWDEDNGYPVITLEGEFRQLVVADGRGMFYDTTDQTAAVINTAYPITFNSTGYSDGISLGTPTSRVMFEEGGLYYISFTVQATSNNASLKTLYFWPKLNGVDVGGSTMQLSIDSNGGSTVEARSSVFALEAGDYIEAYWATTNIRATLDTTPATAFCPATPSVTLTAFRVQK
jgi:hypothetical protein